MNYSRSADLSLAVGMLRIQLTPCFFIDIHIIAGNLHFNISDAIRTARRDRSGLDWFDQSRSRIQAIWNACTGGGIESGNSHTGAIFGRIQCHVFPLVSNDIHDCVRAMQRSH